jgi:hypothetical protein
MMSAPGEYVRAVAVVRLDLGHLELEPELAVKVVEVLPDEESAAAEAARLNQTNRDKNSKYIIQATRWYPRGR